MKLMMGGAVVLAGMTKKQVATAVVVTVGVTVVEGLGPAPGF
jgi:hypothetical protein